MDSTAILIGVDAEQQSKSANFFFGVDALGKIPNQADHRISFNPLSADLDSIAEQPGCPFFALYYPKTSTLKRHIILGFSAGTTCQYLIAVDHRLGKIGEPEYPGSPLAT
jgi:hypothetical protein